MTQVTRDPFIGQKVKGQGNKVTSQSSCSLAARPLLVSPPDKQVTNISEKCQNYTNLLRKYIYMYFPV